MGGSRGGAPRGTGTCEGPGTLAPDRFLGSGHPDLADAREQGLPPLLGLIESSDGGQTWTPVSLLGEADFHVLRSEGDLVYGFDATNARLLVSEDAGATWNERSLPGFARAARRPGRGSVSS
jgi:hypothetical protein